MREVVHCGDVVIVGLKSNIWINVPMQENRVVVYFYLMPCQHKKNYSK